MPNKIDYQAMDDHELLVMAVMQGNDTVTQQEKIAKHLEELNGTVESDHAWVCALKWVIGFVATLAIACLTNILGVW